jgi:GTP-binding nuclear protein Ran
MEQVFKVIVVGDAQVGKTTFIKRHLTGEFTKEYTPTSGVEVHPLTFYTDNHKKVTFNVWDCAGEFKPRFGVFREMYYTKADCAIVMYDCTSEQSAENVSKWIRTINDYFKRDIPMIVCGNKADTKMCFTPSNIACPWELISAKSHYKFEVPFLYLARILTKTPNLNFGWAPAVEPPLVSPITQNDYSQYIVKSESSRKRYATHHLTPQSIKRVRSVAQ